MNSGKLYIIPIPISDSPLEKVLPDYNKKIVNHLRVFIVEKIKTSRQFLRKMDREFPIDDSIFYEQNKHDDYSFHGDALNHLLAGKDVGIMSESGYPGIADPGAKFIAIAQQNKIEIVPLVGPSSLLLALAASGMNGQGFTFNGYLPIKEPARSNQIKFTVQLIQKNGFSQLFIETPHRNEAIFNDFLSLVPSDIKLCVAYDISGEQEKIITRKIEDWKKTRFEFNKVPAVFILGK